MNKNAKIVARSKVVWTICGFFADKNEDGDYTFTRDRAKAKLLTEEAAKQIAAHLSESHMQPSVRQA